MKRPDTTLSVDALDEQKADARETLLGLKSLSCRVIVTTWPYGYGPAQLPFGTEKGREEATRPSFEVFELAALSDKQRLAFIDEWFGDTPDRRELVAGLCIGESAFARATSNALFLSLACTAGTDPSRSLDPDRPHRAFGVTAIRHIIPTPCRL